jgi:hypothetical protein
MSGASNWTRSERGCDMLTKVDMYWDQPFGFKW